MDDFERLPKAPSVGRHHKKAQSLAGFDPLLEGEIVEGPSNKKSNVDLPLENQGGESRIVVPVNQEEVSSALREIASELGKSSPKPTLLINQNDKDLNKANVQKSAPVSPAQRSPSSRSSRRFLGGAAASRSPSEPKGGALWSKKKRHQHNRTRSMPAMPMPWISGNKKSPALNANKSSAAPQHSRVNSRASLSSDMLQELWDLQEQQEKEENSTPANLELAIPTLAKPRPTSFLTGREVVLSSEADATDWQLEIPVKNEFNYTFRAAYFLETYRSLKEGSLDLNNLVGCTSQDLAMFVGGKPSPTTLKFGDNQRSIIESLLECGTDLLQVQGYIRSQPVKNDPAQFREVFIVERQRQFLCVFRGTNNEQCGKVERQPETMKLIDNKSVSVFSDRCTAFQELEPQLFDKLDQLMEETPFCDFVFAGHGFGGAMATLAAYRYAWARPELRVAALVTGSVKVGLGDFRLSANSLPNLKISRVEMGHPRPHKNAGVHAGHTIRLNPAKIGAQIKAYKFADAKVEPSPMRKLRFNNKEKTIADYVNALDDLADVWVKDYYREDGAGVKGKDNEARQMV